MIYLHALIGVVHLVMMTTSTSVVESFASAVSIKQEGNAIADIVRAIPGQTRLSGRDQ